MGTQGKIDEQKAEEIKTLARKGTPVKVLARRFNTTEHKISRIIMNTYKREESKTGILPPNTKQPAQECPICHRLVFLPCLHCQTTRVLKNGTIAKNPDDVDENPKTDLEANQNARYLKIKAMLAQGGSLSLD